MPNTDSIKTNTVGWNDINIIATALGGKRESVNLQLLHGHCHDEKTALDLIKIREKSYKNYLKCTNKELAKLDWFWDDNDILCLSQKSQMCQRQG